MAYNPFDFFRRNQKLFFGGLTILVMFMFILSFGRGDFFSWFPQQMAKWQTHGDAMAVIDGSTIRQSQLGEVAAERSLANGYMIQAAGRVLEASHQAAKKDAEAANPDLRGQLTQFVQVFEQALTMRQTQAEELAFARVQLEQLASNLAKMENDTPKSDDKKRVKTVRVFAETALGELARRAGGERGESGVYFANQPNRTERLHDVRVPTLVIHGLADPMVHVSGGRATAAAVPGAELLLVDGMGHDLPVELFPTFVEAIVRTARRAG